MEQRARRPLDLTALQLYEALESVGFDVAHPDELAEKLRQIDLGLPAEDEFAAMLVWMGKCAFLQKLRQQQYPRSSLMEFRVPDMLAVFDYEGRKLPTLIQIKASHRPHLRWSAAYYERQRRYAELVRLPLLVAWKCRPLGLWTLFDSEHLGGGRRLEFGDALAESLMSKLAGDFMVTFKPNVGLHLVADVLERGDTGESAVLGPHGLLEPASYRMQIRDAYFTNGNGSRFAKLDPPGLWPFLITSSALQHEDVFDGLSVTISFVVREDTKHMDVGHRVLAMLLNQDDNYVRWRSILDGEAFPVRFSDLRNAVDAGIPSGFVQYALYLEPRTKPSFL